MCTTALISVARAGAMVRARVADRNQDSTLGSETHVDGEHVQLVLSLIEVDILVDAVRSVGNVEVAEQLEATLRQMRQPPAA